MWRFSPSQEAPETVDDSALIDRFESLNATVQPGNREESRQRLLREVARQREATYSFNGRTPMFGLVLAHKGMALIAAGVLSVGAVGAVGASGGAGVVTDGVGEVLAALQIKEKAAEESHEYIDAIDQPELPELPDAAASSEDASADGMDRAGDGINNSNASETGLESAADNAFEGAGNADGALDSLPEQANDVPVAPELPEAATEALDGIDVEIPEVELPEVELPDAAGGAPGPR